MYGAIWHMRHKGCRYVYRQGSKDAITTQCVSGENIYHELEISRIDCYLFQCVSVDERQADNADEVHWQTKFFEAMGRKPHVLCQSRVFPLLPPWRIPKDKLNSNVKYFICDGDAQQQNIHQSCNRKES